MNKLVKNGVLLAIGGLSLASCGKKALKEENAFLKFEINTYKVELENVQQMLADANTTIENNILKIAELELNVDSLINDINALYTTNADLNDLISTLYNDIETLNEIILDHEDNITRINSLLAIEMDKDSINQVVINQLNEDLFTLQADYDHLVANPIVVTEARVRVIETALEIQDQLTDGDFQGIVETTTLGVQTDIELLTSVRGQLTNVTATFRSNIAQLQESLRIENVNLSNLQSIEADALAIVRGGANPTNVAAWRAAQANSDIAQAKVTSWETAIASQQQALNRVNELLDDIYDAIQNAG